MCSAQADVCYGPIADVKASRRSQARGCPRGLRTVKKLIGYVPNERASPPLVKREALIFSGSVDADQIIARRIITHGSIRRMSALGQKRTLGLFDEDKFSN